MLRQHIVKSFDKDLQTLRDKLAEMGANTEAQLASAIEALVSRNAELAEAVIKNDKRVNDLQNEIDSLTVRMLATRQPLGFDLRLQAVHRRRECNPQRGIRIRFGRRARRRP